jgi:signal transduction histidine kinase/DNA-binding response OmpR family regulator
MDLKRRHFIPVNKISHLILISFFVIILGQNLELTFASAGMMEHPSMMQLNDRLTDSKPFSSLAIAPGLNGFRAIGFILMAPSTRWISVAGVIMYLLTVIAAAAVTRYVILKRARINYLGEKEKDAILHAQELDRLKIKFITNVSHEFRSPLSLILAPVESLLRNKEDSVTITKKDLELIHRNAKRILHIVNQLLEFRRLEVGEVKLNLTEADIIAFIQEFANSFSDLAYAKNIHFSVEARVDRLITLFDPNKLERILFNLISNAFKFTPEGGNVSMHISIEEKADPQMIKLEVRDTGIGIASENLDKIFDWYFQSELPSNFIREGSGVGLSITREFVKLHGGAITVTSELNKGTCFTITIPICRSQPASEVPAIIAASDDGGSIDKKRSQILVVEDNEDFRSFLKDNLKTLYDIQEARNGTEGWQKTIEIMPDMIVSDILMPEIDGVELCAKVKGDARTCHIPFILLTARSSDQVRLKGFEIGADDYIVKPFNLEILHVRIRNLLKLHSLNRAQQNVEVKASEIKISSLNEIFITKAVKAVEDNIRDPDFSVTELSEILGVSRTHLYRKILALTGKSVIEFIRLIKLQRAAQLLEKSQLTVAEIAYSVGFNNPKYFTKHFKEQYKVVPSAYANRKSDPDSPAV